MKLKDDFRKKENTELERNENYKTADQLTETDYWLIDMHRKQTGIEHYSDEYYYNNILCYNFRPV